MWHSWTGGYYRIDPSQEARARIKYLFNSYTDTVDRYTCWISNELQLVSTSKIKVPEVISSPCLLVQGHKVSVICESCSTQTCTLDLTSAFDTGSSTALKLCKSASSKGRPLKLMTCSDVLAYATRVLSIGFQQAMSLPGLPGL